MRLLGVLRTSGCAGWWTWLTLRLPLLGSPQLLQRIALTVLFLALARVGQFIPLPGVNLAAVASAAAGEHCLPCQPARP